MTKIESVYFTETAKAWGTSTRILNQKKRVIEYCIAEQGRYSSVHYHKLHDNEFHVMSGILEVNIEPRDNSLSCIPKLVYPGHCLLVPAGIVHSFKARTECEFIEVYSLPKGSIVRPLDITRLEGWRHLGRERIRIDPAKELELLKREHGLPSEAVDHDGLVVAIVDEKPCTPVVPIDNSLSLSESTIDLTFSDSSEGGHIQVQVFDPMSS